MAEADSFHSSGMDPQRSIANVRPALGEPREGLWTYPRGLIEATPSALPRNPVSEPTAILSVTPVGRTESAARTRYVPVRPCKSRIVLPTNTEMVELYADQKARATVYTWGHRPRKISSRGHHETCRCRTCRERTAADERPVVSPEDQLAVGILLLELDEQHAREALVLQQAREGIIMDGLRIFGAVRVADREANEVRVMRKKRRERPTPEPADLCGAFFAGIEPEPEGYEIVDVEFKPTPVIGAYVGPNPIFVLDHFQVVQLLNDPGAQYRWVDPSGLSDNLRRGCASALPPCAVPFPHSFGAARRWYIRRFVGPIWWETGVADKHVRPGDVLISKISSASSTDPRYFDNGDWDLARVQNVQCGRRKHRLTEMIVHSAGDHQWQIRRITSSCETVAFSWSWDPLTKGVLRKELDDPRPVFIPLGKAWETAVMALAAPTVEGTLRLRYDAVIRAAPEQHVAALRLHMGAALKERDEMANPVAFLKSLQEAEALLAVQTGLQPGYAPK